MNYAHSPRWYHSLRRFRPWLFVWAAVIGLVPTSAHASEPAPHKSTARYEIMFMEDMIPHHLSAARMASLCQGRIIHPELLAMCASIEASQTEEVRQMQAWLRGWYGEERVPGLFEPQEMDIEHMASLTGEPFEKAFMKMMIPHHMLAIEESAQCQVRVFHGELQQMCRDIVRSQADEIHQMRGWLCQWYGVCDLELRRSAMTEVPGKVSAGDGSGVQRRLDPLRERIGR